MGELSFEDHRKGTWGTENILSVPRTEGMNTPVLRVMIMAQQPIFRQGILTILCSMTDCEIVGQPTNVSEVLELVRSCQPEIALLDTLSETVDMLDIAQHLRTFSPQTAVIMLSEQESEERLFQAMKAGAAAYFTRNVTPGELLEAVRRVSQGEYLINDAVLSQPALPSRVLQSFRTFRNMSRSTEEDPHPLGPCLLSHREVEILERIGHGMSNKEIAKLLEISDQTVKNHITSILRKLKVNDRTAAVVCAIKNHWIQVD